MVDIFLIWSDNTGSADWYFASGDDLISAILVSLFTDAEASTDYSYPVPTDYDPRRWWANTTRQSSLGSRLWQLKRARNGQATLLRARDLTVGDVGVAPSGTALVNLVASAPGIAGNAPAGIALVLGSPIVGVVATGSTTTAITGATRRRPTQACAAGYCACSRLRRRAARQATS